MTKPISRLIKKQKNKQTNRKLIVGTSCDKSFKKKKPARKQ